MTSEQEAMLRNTRERVSALELVLLILVRSMNTDARANFARIWVKEARQTTELGSVGTPHPPDNFVEALEALITKSSLKGRSI